MDDTEYEGASPEAREHHDKATQFPDIRNKYSQTEKKMTDKETDTYDELNNIIGDYILQMKSDKFKSKEVSRGELMTQAKALPITQRRDERSSSSSSSDSEGFLGRTVRRGFRLAEVAMNTAITGANITMAISDAINDLTTNNANLTEEEEDEEEEVPSASTDFMRERSRSHDDDDADDDLGEQLLRRGASRSRSSTPKGYPKKKL